MCRVMQNISFYLADHAYAKGYSTIYKRAGCQKRDLKGSRVGYTGIIYRNTRVQESDRNHLSGYSKQTSSTHISVHVLNWNIRQRHVYRNHLLDNTNCYVMLLLNPSFLFPKIVTSVVFHSSVTFILNFRSRFDYIFAPGL